jgi:hypothetical protein
VRFEIDDDQRFVCAPRIRVSPARQLIRPYGQGFVVGQGMGLLPGS